MSSPTTAPDDRGTGKAARILAAAEELALKRGVKGVTIAEIATKAHVGKGTVYLYWRTKESLFLELIARGFGTVLDELAAEVRDRAELARPEHLCPRLVHAVLALPLVRALQTSDTETLGALADDPRSRSLVVDHGAVALIRRLLPVWRRHALARTDWDLERQAFALQVLAVGFLQATVAARAIAEATLDPPAREEAITDAVAALLGGERAAADPAADPAVAADVVAELSTAAEALRQSVDRLA